MTLRALLGKDLRLEWRGRDVVAAAATVALLVALVGNVAFADRVDTHRAVSGMLWIALVFSAQVGLARSFVIERERGTLDATLASPVPPFLVFVSKLVVHLITLALVATLVLATLLGFFRLPAPPIGSAFLAVVALGLLGIALVTTTTAALAMYGTHWVLLVPLLSLPLLFPIAAAAIPATDLLILGAPADAVWPHLRVLLAYDVVAATAAWLLIPYVLEP